MSAEVLRQAAALMRERAEAATSGPWEFRPRRGFQSVSDNPATIGFLDDAGYFVMLREGTWTTEGDMTYVASWHPAVALAVADWLNGEADSFDSTELWFHPDDGESVQEDKDFMFKGALAVARAYLGSDA